MKSAARIFPGLVCLVLALALPVGARDDKETLLKDAKEFFNRYVELGNKFDPALAELYSDSADIQNVRYYQGGKTRTLKLAAPEYKKMVAAMMPAAKARNDIDTFSKTTYTVLGDGVKIQSLRHSTLKNYDSWLVLLLRKEKGGMKIYQELSQSRP